MQVGYFGLLKAISHFDPAAGASLGAYARPCISGELKRYFRDKRWALHVDRQVQELILQVRDVTEPLAQQLGRPRSTPTWPGTLESPGTSSAWPGRHSWPSRRPPWTRRRATMP